jgi:hypothetical protein
VLVRLSLVDAAGGVSLRVPSQVSVFDGQRLYTFEKGSQELDGQQFEALLKGVPYLSDGDRTSLDDELALALVDVLAQAPDRLGEADSDLDASALSRLAEGLDTAVSR